MKSNNENATHGGGVWQPVGATYDYGSWAILLSRYDEEREAYQFKVRELGAAVVEDCELDPQTGEWYDADE